MAYYDALIAEWPLLTPGTTAAKLAQLNALTVSGTIPTLIGTSGAAIFNCLVWSEFNVITAAQQTTLMQVCAIPGQINGGSSSPFIAPFFGTLAAKMPTTIANLTALAQALSQPWWQANGYKAPINNSDLAAAGNLT